MTETKPTRGFPGAVLRLLRAGEYRLTVTGRREISAHYLRLSFDAGGLLADRAPHPTMRIRRRCPRSTRRSTRSETCRPGCFSTPATTTTGVCPSRVAVT